MTGSSVFSGGCDTRLGSSGYLTAWYGNLRDIPGPSGFGGGGIEMNRGTFWRGGSRWRDDHIYNTFARIEIGAAPLTAPRDSTLLIIGDLKIINRAGNPLLVVKNNGNVGINTDTPTQRLHILGNLMIEDGTQRENKLLTSDAQGIAIWQSPIGGTGAEAGQGLYGWCEDFTGPPGCQAAREPAKCNEPRMNECNCLPDYTKIQIGSRGKFRYYSCYRE